MVKTLALMDLVYLWYVYKCIPEGITRSLSIELSGVTPIAASQEEISSDLKFSKESKTEEPTNL